MPIKILRMQRTKLTYIFNVRDDHASKMGTLPLFPLHAHLVVLHSKHLSSLKTSTRQRNRLRRELTIGATIGGRSYNMTNMGKNTPLSHNV